MPEAPVQFVPDAATLAAVLPRALLWAAACAWFNGWLRTRRGVRTAYTRKTYHFLIISVAMLVHLRYGTPGAVTYGAAVGAVVLYAIARGDDSAFYQSIARPTDAPHRTRFIVIPFVTTALGGFITNLLFPLWAPVGYMAVAWGDAVGEPVGSRWGRHPYRVPSLFGVAATRTLEGSAAVLLAGTAAAWMALVGTGADGMAALGVAFAVGVATACVEAASHHGLDNLTVQVAAAAVAAALM